MPEAEEGLSAEDVGMDMQHEVAAYYAAYGHIVLRRARDVLGNAEEAQDVLQEIFVSLLSKPHQLRGPGPHTAWFYRATTNLCLNRLRNQKTRRRLLEERNQMSTPHEPESRSEALTLLRQIISRVPANLAEIAIYYHVDSMTQDEIASIVGCSRRQVGYLLERFANKAGKLVKNP